MLARNRFGLISFHDRDHGDGAPTAWPGSTSLLAREGVADADGEVWLHCYPRVLGYTFKPVSFWYCHRADGSLAAIVVEVNNTFGERHCYLLNSPHLAFGRELQADKVFHVSPFCDGRRRLPLPLHAQRPASGSGPAAYPHRKNGRTHRPPRRARPADPDQRVGSLAAADHGAPAAAFFGMPLMTLGVIARIHWQAVRLWAQACAVLPQARSRRTRSSPAEPTLHSHTTQRHAPPMIAAPP